MKSWSQIRGYPYNLVKNEMVKVGFSKYTTKTKAKELKTFR